MRPMLFISVKFKINLYMHVCACVCVAQRWLLIIYYSITDQSKCFLLPHLS